MNIALSGGGTAGHIIPNIALLPHLKKQFDNIIYIGNANGVEATICKQYNINFAHCDSIKFDRVKKLRNIKIPFVLPKCIAQAKKILANNKIDIVFSKGGYVALPVAIAAKLLKIPLICHESDSTLGLTNKLTSKFADTVITSSPISGKNFINIGNPLREEIFNANPQSVFHIHNINTNKPILLVVCGSLGSQSINRVIYDSLDKLLDDFCIIHICGKEFVPITRTDYYQLAYVNNIADYLQVADYVIARCGASLSGELTALNKKVLYIPLPSTASRGDQISNAKNLQKQQLALVLSQEDMTPATLVDSINQLKTFKKCHYTYDRTIPSKITKQIIKTVKYRHQNQVNKKKKKTLTSCSSQAH